MIFPHGSVAAEEALGRDKDLLTAMEPRAIAVQRGKIAEG